MPVFAAASHHPPDRLRIIGAASGLGAPDSACAEGPQAFHRSQAWHALADEAAVDWGRTLFPAEGPGNGSMPRIAEFCGRLADEVALALENRELPLVIGGDHSVAIGTWSGVARACRGVVGLLWIDAHLDSHTPASTYSGAVHGMPLACLLGRGDKRLLVHGLADGVQLDPAHVVVLGARSYETEEFMLLQRLGVRVIAQAEIRQHGFAACLDEALAIVGRARPGYGVTIDLDAVDPRLAPGVGSPEPDGLAGSDVLLALHALVAHPGLQAVEIVEFNPDRDRHGDTARLLAEMIQALLPLVRPAREAT